MRIGVLMGGRSLERDISLRSGRRVSRALDMLGHEVLDLDVNENLVPVLRREHLDLVYIALHGKFGEDGTVQELLEILTSLTRGSAFLQHHRLQQGRVQGDIPARGNPHPALFRLERGDFPRDGRHALEAAGEKLGFPWWSSLAAPGSALGIRIAASNEEVRRRSARPCITMTECCWKIC